MAAALLSAASHAPASTRQGGCTAFPSKLDYLVLASLADSPNLLAMSAYPAAAPCGLPRAAH
jgi:hypothetical protein